MCQLLSITHAVAATTPATTGTPSPPPPTTTTITTAAAAARCCCCYYYCCCMCYLPSIQVTHKTTNGIYTSMSLQLLQLRERLQYCVLQLLWFHFYCCSPTVAVVVVVVVNLILLLLPPALFSLSANVSYQSDCCTPSDWKIDNTTESTDANRSYNQTRKEISCSCSSIKNDSNCT